MRYKHFISLIFTGVCFIYGCKKSASQDQPQTSGLPALNPLYTSANGLPPALPATGKIYLGAYVDPDHTYKPSQVDTLQSQIGQRLSILQVYKSFNALQTQQAVEAALTKGIANGSITSISWRPPQDSVSDPHRMTLAQFDSIVTNTANAMKASGRPIYLRYAWEMNLSFYSGANPAAYGPFGNDSTGYVSMWREVVGIFRRVQVPNVAFVWCPYVVNSTNGNLKFYPGDNWVDWISADGYDNQGDGAAAFGQVFDSWYNTFSQKGKPMMIAETGAMQPDQSKYIQAMGQLFPTKYTAIKALIYWDDYGQTGKQWQILPATAGITAFSALANQKEFTYSSK